MAPPPGIVLTTDLSDCSLRALEPAVEVARKLCQKLTILSIVEPYTPITLGEDAGSGTALEAIETLQREELDHVGAEIQKIRAGLPADLETEQLVVVSRHPVQEIVRQVDALDVNLLVMATHGRTGIAHAIMGSTTEHVLRQSRVPVLIIPTRSQE